MPINQQKSQSYRLWAGRSTGELSKIAIQLGESITLDKELYREDLFASLTHAKMLLKVGLLTKIDFSKIKQGLQQIHKEIKSGSFHFDIALEDIHTHIEKRLIELCGDAGRRLHTARSRNDQIAVDTHLYVMGHASLLGKGLLRLCSVLLRRATSETDTLLPGYTHLQIAQPIRLSHHLLAHLCAFLRDVERFSKVAYMAGYLPLGSGALAGVNYRIDRDFTRKNLGFHSIYSNAMDAVSSRDHILDLVYATCVFMTHASRLSAEIVLWHSQEFSFLELPNKLTTGSSIMPQKKNPDLAELIRGKTGRIQANLHNLLTNLKGLPMSYNRDLQEDRFPLLDSCKQSLLCLEALTAMMQQARFNRKRMRLALQKGFATATDLADALVQKKGLTFREAHHLVGHLVDHCSRQQLTLEEIPQDARSKISFHFQDDSFYKQAIDLETSVERKKSVGSTSLQSQELQLKQVRTALQKWKNHNWPKLNL